MHYVICVKVSELQALAGLTCLAHLNVGGTRITDQSLLCLRNHPSLKKLNLHQTQVCDQGLAHLAGKSWCTFKGRHIGPKARSHDPVCQIRSPLN